MCAALALLMSISSSSSAEVIEQQSTCYGSGMLAGAGPPRLSHCFQLGACHCIEQTETLHKTPSLKYANFNVTIVRHTTRISKLT